MWRNTVPKKNWDIKFDGKDHVLLLPPDKNSSRVISSLELKKNSDGSITITVAAGSESINKIKNIAKDTKIREINPLKKVLDIKIEANKLVDLLTKITNYEVSENLKLPEEQIKEYAAKLSIQVPRP